jgi:hypothetical protein
VVDNTTLFFLPKLIEFRVSSLPPESSVSSIDKSNLWLLPELLVNLPAEVTGKRARSSLGPNHLGKLVGDEVEIPLGLPDTTRLSHEIEDALFDGMKQMGRFIRKLGSHILRIGIVCLFVNPE